MFKFLLFRIKTVKQIYRTDYMFAEKDMKPAKLIETAINQLPYQIGTSTNWRVGNIDTIKISKDNSAMFFAFGKISKSTKDAYDEEKGEFVEKEDIEATHAHIIIDLETQVCAIATKRKLSVNSAARYLASFLSRTQVCKERSTMITIASIISPERFIESIKKAKKIYRFNASFSPPNPADLDELIYNPLKKALADANAEKGNAYFHGKNLDKEKMGNLARSLASSGDRASARFLPERGAAKSMNMGENQISASHENDIIKDTVVEKRNIAGRIRALYYNVRDGDGQ